MNSPSARSLSQDLGGITHNVSLYSIQYPILIPHMYALVYGKIVGKIIGIT